MRKILMLTFLTFFIFLNVFICSNRSLVSLVCGDTNLIDYYNDGRCEMFSVECSLEDVLDVIKLKNLKIFEIDNRVIVEGYNDTLNRYIVKDGDKVNVQLSACGGRVVLGYPLIKKSF